MKANIGSIDRILRIIVGLGLIGWAAIGGPVWAWIGILPLATAAIGWCPPYAILGINTCGAKSQS